MIQIQKFSLAMPAILLAFTLTACEPSAPPVAPEPSAQDMFFEHLSILCGKAYPGQLVSDQEVDAEMSGQPMAMHVATCDQNEIQIPFHISENDGSWNRSRTWTITRTENGLRLKHRHRHEDGSLDVVTNYGGDTETAGTQQRQEFPVDDESITLFEANELQQSVTNIWAMEISPPGTPNARFAYELRRPEDAGGRFFRVEFDLAKSIDIPPPPWGDEN
ncbi:MAG: hypothetical protein ABJO01_14390 [Parasphingorhabdus sp.]|uniref:hypothetical protein n=1 Tax=Parasphingorhabdus sp. TaxID=2709688 RepID=UPI0032981CF7